MGHDYIFDRRCAGCVQKCDDILYYACAQNDYHFYKRKVEEEEQAKSMARAPKQSYKAFEFTGRPSTIAEDLNKFFAENSNVEVVSVTRVDGYANETAPGVLMIVKEK